MENLQINIVQLIEIIFSLGIIVWLYLTYVSVIKKRNKVLEAFSCVDVQLKKRYDNIPNIIAIAKKYMEYEKSVLEDITKVRSKYQNIPNEYENINKKLALTKELADKMEKLSVVLENYPDLKADRTMIMTMQTLNDTEEHIAAARRFYNFAVNDLKNAVEIFPSSIFAKLCNIKAVEFFNIDENEKQVIKADEYLK